MQKYDQIYCDSLEALCKLSKKIDCSKIQINTFSPAVYLNNVKYNYVPNRLSKKKLKTIQISINKVAAEVYNRIKGTIFDDYKNVATNQIVDLHRTLPKAACIKREDLKKKKAIVVLETGDKELDSFINVKWEGIFPKKDCDFLKFFVTHNGKQRIKVFRPNFLEKIKLNSWENIFFLIIKKINHLNYFSGSKKLIIFREDHLTREICVNLIKNRISPVFFKLPKLKLDPINDAYFNKLKKRIIPIVRKHIKKFVIEDVGRNLLNFYFSELRKKLDLQNTYENYFNKYLSKFEGKLLCISSYPSLLLTISLSNVLRKKGLKLISTQHGVNREINKFYEYGSCYFENSIADLLFVKNEEAKKISDLSVFKYGVTKCIGAPKQMYLKVKQKKIRDVFFISTRISTGNLNNPTGYNTDLERVKNEIFLTKKILNKLPYRVKFKAYPFEDYYVDTDPVHRVVENSENIDLIYTTRDLQDYLKEIEMIITSRATSTLSLCLISNIPVVFINYSSEYSVKEKLISKFSDSLFYFEFYSENFEKKISSFLKKPREVILKDWEKKSKKRKELIEKYFCNSKTESAGKLASKYIIENNFFKKIKCKD